MSDLTMSMFANRQDYEAAVAEQKAMTPHDELMALAGKATPGEWRQEHRRTATGGYSTEVFDEAGKAIATLAWHALPTRYEGEVGITSTDREANAAFIAAACNFVRSDAFRAMVRDAARGRYVITRGKLPTKTTAGYHYEDGVSYTTPAEAIDAAASGAGEV